VGPTDIVDAWGRRDSRPVGHRVVEGLTRDDAGPASAGPASRRRAQCSEGLMWYSNTMPPTAISRITPEMTIAQM